MCRGIGKAIMIKEGKGRNRADRADEAVALNVPRPGLGLGGHLSEQWPRPTPPTGPWRR